MLFRSGATARRGMALVAAAGVMTGLVACGDSGSEAAGTGSASGGDSSALLERASAEVEKFSQPAPDDAWPAPTEAVEAGSKRAAIVSCGQLGPDCNAASGFATEAIERAGWTASPVFDGEFSPAATAAAVDRAVQQGYDAIVIIVVDVNSIKASIDNALAKGVAISCVLCDSGSYRGKVLDATPDFTKQGAPVAWNIIKESEGSAKVVAFDDKAYPVVAQKLSGLQSTLEDECPECTYEQKDFPTAELAQPGPPTFSALLSSAGPGTITDAVGPYDLFSVPMAKTVAQLGRDDVTVSGFDVTKDMAQALSDGSLPVGATTGSSYEYATWAAVDLVIRQVAGADTWDATDLPSVLITKDNAADYIDRYYGPDFDFKAKFAELWGRS